MLRLFTCRSRCRYIRGSATEREKMKDVKTAYREVFEKAVQERAPIPLMQDMSRALVPYEGPHASMKDVEDLCK